MFSGSNLTVTKKGSGTESLLAKNYPFTLGYHATETINASAAGAETFGFSSGFGNETVAGFTATGSGADTVKFATSAFSYLERQYDAGSGSRGRTRHRDQQPKRDRDSRHGRRQPHSLGMFRIDDHRERRAVSLHLI